MRTIIHVDMDAFYASIEQRDNPSLKGKPVIVGGRRNGRGVATTASYEARQYGCRSAMSIMECERRCPHGIFLSPRMHVYQAVSKDVMTILKRYTPLVEKISIDEAFLDVTGSEKLFGSGKDIAKKIQQDIQNELQLTTSIGISWNKYLAKMASDMQKPNGITVLAPADLKKVIWPMSIDQMYGIGEKTKVTLNQIGIYTIADLAQSDVNQLAPFIGKRSQEIIERARGIDPRPVIPYTPPKSMGSETTFNEDQQNLEYLTATLLFLTDKVGHRLRKDDFKAKGLIVKWRTPDFKTYTRSMQFDEPTNHSKTIWEAATTLFQSHWTQRPIRLIGITLTSLSHKDDDHQEKLFGLNRTESKDALDQILDQLNERFENGITRASLLNRTKGEEYE